MASVTEITESELLEALAAAASGSAPEDARTVTEMVLETGIHERRIRAALRRIAAEGRLAIHTVRRAALDGRLSRVPAYTIAPTPRPPAKPSPKTKSSRSR